MDTVSVKTKVDFKAFATPDSACIVIPSTVEVELYLEAPIIPVEELAPEVLDALARQWLDHLYAKCGRESPFRLSGS